MNRPIPVMLTAVAAVLVLAGPVTAGGFFLQAHGGYSFFNLDDVNDSIDAVNEVVGENLLDQVSSGWDLGFHAGYSITAELDLSLGYGRLSANSGFSRDGYLVEYDMPADLYEISLDYLPSSDRKVRVGAGSTLGMIWSDTSLLVTDPVEGDRLDVFKGSGFLFAGYGVLDVSFDSPWSLFSQAGFRHAVIGELKVDGETVFNPDSLDDKLRFSYSGFFLRVGVKFQP